MSYEPVSIFHLLKEKESKGVQSYSLEGLPVIPIRSEGSRLLFVIG